MKTPQLLGPKFILFLAIIFIITIRPITGIASSNHIFKDVVPGSYYEEAVTYLTEGQIITGYEDMTFKPNKKITRAEVAKIISKVLDLHEKGSPNSSFTDTNNHWAEKDGVIALVEHAKIMQGDGNGKFRPNAPITRAEIAQVIVDGFGLKSIANFQSSFQDLDEVSWASDAISIVHGHKIINGKGNNTYEPASYATRAELATIVYNAIQVSPPITPTLPDETIVIKERIDEIRKNWLTLKPKYDGQILKHQPNVSPPYRLGEINEAALIDALNMVNFIRTLSYLPNNILLNESFNKDAQAASIVNAANNELTHKPSKPKDMDESLFQLGYNGASTSNIAAGYKRLTSSIQLGYMPDSSDSNRDSLGHRRWILSPLLEQVGFGFALSTKDIPYSAMKVTAPDMWKNESAPYDTINWPAKVAFPTQFFHKDDPWSVSLNTELYDPIKLAEVTVKLTRLKDKKTWHFANNRSTDGFFNIDTNDYGYTPYTIIFQPIQDREYHKDDSYHVEIEGIYTINGKKTKTEFKTSFFDL